MTIQFGERRKTRGRIAIGTCSIFNVDFNGGGLLLRLGAAGALLAAAFAAHRFLIRKRKSGSMPDPLDRVDREGIQENSGKRLAPHEAADGENEGKGGVQIFTSDCPAIIMAVEETQLEDCVSYDHNVAIVHEIQKHDEKIEENLSKESQEGMERNHRETKEYSFIESRERIEFSTEQENQDSLSNVFEVRKCLKPVRDGRADRLSVKNVALEIHREPQTQIKEEEDEQIAKISFDSAAVNGAKGADEATKHETGTKLIQEKNVSGERRRQRATAGHGFLVLTLAIVFAVLASFLCHVGFDAGSHHIRGRLYCSESSLDSGYEESSHSKKQRLGDKVKKVKEKDKGRSHKHKHNKKQVKKKDQTQRSSSPVQLSKFLGREKDDGVRRSAVSGKKIQLKLDKSKEDKKAETNRNELLKFLNASYD